MKKLHLILPFCTFMMFISTVNAQIPSGAYLSDTENMRHELKLHNDYLTLTVYRTQPAEFIKTIGGFYTINDNTLMISLEFNSNYQQDSLREIKIPFVMKEKNLILQLDGKISFEKLKEMSQDLDGQWLFATRGPDTGQERRGDENPRKTLKFLLDGRFQWIAYQTETMNFSGTGGGSFTSKNGIYTENIEFFSRDNNRVGASLEFNYEIKGNDWHHTGKNSKGEPMYEIWSKRN